MTPLCFRRFAFRHAPGGVFAGLLWRAYERDYKGLRDYACLRTTTRAPVSRSDGQILAYDSERGPLAVNRFPTGRYRSRGLLNALPYI